MFNAYIKLSIEGREEHKGGHYKPWLYIDNYFPPKLTYLLGQGRSANNFLNSIRQALLHCKRALVFQGLPKN